MLDEQDGQAEFAVEFGESRNHAVGLGRPQARHHLVEQQKFWLGGERTRNFQALTVRQRQRGCRLMTFAEEVEPSEYLAGMAARRCGIVPTQHGADHDVVLDGQRGERPHQLECAADAAATNLVRGKGVDAFTGKIDRTPVRREDPGEDVKQRRLARPVRADDDKNPTALYAKAYSV